MLAQMPIGNHADMETAAVQLAKDYGIAVLVKGGHGVDDANDVLALPDGRTTWFEGEHIDNTNTHGTGCTLSSAIASYLALANRLRCDHRCKGRFERRVARESQPWRRSRSDGPCLDHALSRRESPNC